MVPKGAPKGAQVWFASLTHAEAFAAHFNARLLHHQNQSKHRTAAMYLWRQWTNGPKRFKELRRRGVQKFLAAVAAGSPTGFWRMSRHPALQKALRNHVFDSLGLPRLYLAPRSSTQSNRRGT
jgi:hypothetical protein